MDRFEMGFGFKKSLRRRALSKPNLLYYYWLYGANAERRWRARRHPASYPEAASLAEQIGRDGIVKADMGTFLSEEGQRHYLVAKEQLIAVSRSPEVREILGEGEVSEAFKFGKKDYVINLIPPAIVHSPDSALIRLALDPKLLEIAAGYFGLWPRLYGMYSWLNFPTDEGPRNAQLWHRDPEDLKVLKAFIYLNDVDEDTGPFCYIPRSQAFGEYAGINPPHKDRIRILDEEMEPFLPPEKHMICTGPADTMILADTVGFHRGGKPRSKNRLMLTFSYTSNWPAKRTLELEGEPNWQPNAMQRMAMKFE